MALNVERLIQRDLDRWIYLLGLGRWRVTWDLRDDLGENAAWADYRVKRSGYRKAHLLFARPEMTSAAAIEKAVIHELLHIFDLGIGNDAHKLIYRLERRMRMVRQRASRKP